MTVPYPWLVKGRLQGGDVSSAQTPNLALMMAMKAAGFIACDVKACDYDVSLSKPFTDPACLKHLAFAREAGLYTGTYGFFKSNLPWQPQAEQFLRVYDLTGPLTMRPTIDWEDQKRILPNPQGAFDGVIRWCDFVGPRTGQRPTVYTGPAITDIMIAKKVNVSALLSFDLFEAHYRWDTVTGHDDGLVAPKPIVIGGITWEPSCWQCGGNGAPLIPGVHVPLDRDIYFFPTIARFESWCANGTPPAPGPGFDLMTTRGIQGALKQLGYDPGPIDGVLGPRTVQAVRLFQSAHWLATDGIVGPKTRDALAIALKAG